MRWRPFFSCHVGLNLFCSLRCRTFFLSFNCNLNQTGLNARLLTESNYLKNNRVHERTLFALSLLMIWVNHIVACVWHGVGWNEAVFYNRTSWLSVDNNLDSSMTIRYVRAFYFSLQTAFKFGYGDIVARTLTEAWVLSFIIIVFTNSIR